MPTIYEYLNSISDLQVAMAEEYGDIDFQYNYNYKDSEKLRYSVTLRTGCSYHPLVMGWGGVPCEAYDEAKAKLDRYTQNEKAIEIRRRHNELADEEIAKLRGEDVPA